MIAVGTGLAVTLLGTTEITRGLTHLMGIRKLFQWKPQYSYGQSRKMNTKKKKNRP